MLLPAPGGPDDRDLLAAPHAQRHAVEHERLRPRRIGEAHVLEGDLAARRLRQRDRAAPARTITGRTLRISNSRSAAPDGLRELAPDLGELAEPGRGEHRVEHELRQPPGA